MSTSSAENEATPVDPAGLAAALAASQSWWERLLARQVAIVFLVSFLACCANLLVDPVPVPLVSDEFSYLLAGETLASGRLANPPHELWEHFETFHVLTQPTYASKYPPAQGLILALGLLMGHAIVGVYLSVAACCAAICWALKGYLQRPEVAFGASLVVALQLSLQHYWACSYWGGAAAALGGALVVGSIPRILRGAHGGAGWACGIGIATLFLSRPFEGFVVCLVPAFLILRWWWEHGLANRQVLLRVVLPCVFLLASAIGFQAQYNKSITGSYGKLPHAAYNARYFKSPFFVWQQPQKEAPKLKNPRLQKYFDEWAFFVTRAQFQPFLRYQERALTTVRTVLGLYFGGLLLVALLLPWKREQWPLWTILIMATIGFVLVRPFNPHYGAPVAVVVVILAAGAAERLLRMRGGHGARWMAIGAGLLCLLDAAADVSDPDMFYVRQYSNGKRVEIENQLRGMGPQHLIFVAYDDSANIHSEWVYNGADVDKGTVVWAHDLGPQKNQQALEYYPSRTPWRLTIVGDQIRLAPYEP